MGGFPAPGTVPYHIHYHTYFPPPSSNHPYVQSMGPAFPNEHPRPPLSNAHPKSPAVFPPNTRPPSNCPSNALLGPPANSPSPRNQDPLRVGGTHEDPPCALPSPSVAPKSRIQEWREDVHKSVSAKSSQPASRRAKSIATNGGRHDDQDQGQGQEVSRRDTPGTSVGHRSSGGSRSVAGRRPRHRTRTEYYEILEPGKSIRIKRVEYGTHERPRHAGMVPQR